MRKTLLQILALLVLPLVAGLIYWSGKRPPPPAEVLPGGEAGAEAPGGAPTVKLPAALKSGWKLDGQVVRYNKKTLFDRINGAAPAYIRAGFAYSLGAEYRKQGLPEAVVADVYDMGSVARGLGMYSTERDSSYTFIQVGDEAYLASGSLNLWVGRFYVKLAGFEEGEAMDAALKELAQGLAAVLPRAKDHARQLATLKLLPDADRRPHSGGYSHQALADIKGLEQAYYADYGQGETPMRLFVVQAKDEARAAQRYDALKAYFAKDVPEVNETRLGPLQILQAAGDTTTLLMRKGKLLTGGVDLEGAEQLKQARALLLKKLGVDEQG